MGMNFNVVEGPEEIDYDAILRDYRNLDLPVRTIREKYGLSNGKWQKVVRKFKEDGEQLRGLHHQAKKAYSNTEYIGAKNYYYDKRAGKYRILKHVRGKEYYFGSYETEEEAIDHVRELRENGWNGLIK